MIHRKGDVTFIHVICFSDINECLEEVVCQNGECMNLVGSFSCMCKRGYKLSTNRQQCIGEYTLNTISNSVKYI